MMKEIKNGAEIKRGRINTLNKDQEIALKQVWAYFLKYLGYEISLSVDEIKFRECFVNSSSIDGMENEQELQRKPTKSSNASISSKTMSSNSIAQKGPGQRNKLFGFKVSNTASHIDKKSPRLSSIKNGDSFDSYEMSDTNNDGYEEVLNHYIVSSHIADQIQSLDDNISDIESEESFFTVSSSFNVEEKNSEPPSVPSKVSLTSLLNFSRKKTSKSASFTPNTHIIPNSSKLKPSEVHNFLFEGHKIELLDNLFLRFIRARKLDNQKTMKMMVNSIHWRTKGFYVHDLVREGDAPLYVADTHRGVSNNFKAEKAFMGGFDRRGNPLLVFMSRKHFASDSSLEDTKTFTILLMEWMGFQRNRSGITDQYSVLFDLTGFSTKNIDNPPIKFLTEVLEAHYPEILGVIIVHNAPWIFSMVWNIIKNWIDPEVASKIYFTKDLVEVEKFIEKKYIPKHLGGQSNISHEYYPPTKQHTKPPLDKDSRYHSLTKERARLFLAYLRATKRWIESVNPEVSAKFLQDKINLSMELSENYVNLDPYLRNPGVFDRNNSFLSWTSS